MITQIEIDGFKTFKDFKVELAPFQVIVGPNGSGKSNLFDALQLLSHLAGMELILAFKGLRGEAREVFTQLPNEKNKRRTRTKLVPEVNTDTIFLAVEMLVDRKVKDRWGQEAELKFTRLRYELTIVRRARNDGLEQFFITREVLTSIPQHKDMWSKKYNLLNQTQRIPFGSDDVTSFITTAAKQGDSTKPNKVIISLVSENEQAGNFFFADQMESTVLSGVSKIDFPHVFAARSALQSLQFLHLDAQALRHPSSLTDPSTLALNGEYLPATLARIKGEDPLAFHLISLNLAGLVDIMNIDVERDQVHGEYRILARSSDNRTFPATLLSDGTLRLLALATMSNDPQLRGTLCIEEPENGVHPLHLQKIAHLLRDIATNFSDPEREGEPLRQVLVTSHSPLFVSQPEIIDALLLAITPYHLQDDTSSMLITRMAPVITSDRLSQNNTSDDNVVAVETFTIDTVIRYLNGTTLVQAKEKLDKARTSIVHER